MFGYLFISSPSCASLTGGYSHLTPIGVKTYSVMNQLNELIFEYNRKWFALVES